MLGGWTFYNSSGEIIHGAQGAWMFYNTAGEVQTTLGTGGGGGSSGGSSWSVLTNGDPVTPEVVFDSNGDVIMVETCNGALC